MKRAPNTRISLLVVGGGIAGLTLAIEAHRKGHNVRVFERRPQRETFGEVIAITVSALRTLKKWARSKLHAVLTSYARGLDIPIEYSATGTSYFEEDNHGGAILSDGRRVTADFVVAADGVGSKSWGLVAGRKEEPISSGFVLYRVTFPVDVAMGNEVVKSEFGEDGDRPFLHAGPGAHMVSSFMRADIRGRVERVSCAQKTGFKNREVFHNTDWDAVARNREILGKMVWDWALRHDPEQYVYENYGRCAEHLLRPWTAQERLGASERGEAVEDEGEW
ncbi:hypothetical protein BDW62DRAFT_200880 [Aspergillus aurantiobrunneus]